MASAETPSVVGIDLGGTKILFAVVDGDGRITRREKETTAVESAETIITQIVTGIEHIREKSKADIAAVGVGVPGTVDIDAGRVVATANLPLDDVDLGKKISAACGLPVVVGNDVTLSTVGEAWYGAGRGLDHVFGIFVGTGIGGGLIVDGKPYAGGHSSSGEVGHMLVRRNGPKCGCGKRGCLESLASRTAIERDIRIAVQRGRTSVLADAIRNGERIRSGALRKAVEADDGLVRSILVRAAEFIGETVGSVANLLDPDAVVVGGGVIEACGDLLMPVIEKSATERMIRVPGGPVPIMRSQLGDDAGIMGAAAMAHEGLRARRPGGPVAYVPQIEWIATGEARINGERYVADVVIRADGSIRKRKRKLSRRVHGSAHLVSEEEVRYICKGHPQALVVGTGSDGRLTVGDDARHWLEEQTIALAVLPSPDAVNEFRVMRGPRALLLHLRD